MPPGGEVALELFSVPVSSCAFILLFNFCLYNPPNCLRSVYHFLIVFCFDLFLSGAILSFRGIMASANNDTEKTPSEDDHQDPKLKEKVKSEAEDEEREEDQRSCTRSIVASIGVVTNPNKFKRSAWISTGGGVPCHTLDLMRYGVDSFSPSSWEPQGEGMMNIAANTTKGDAR
jgi:hypothetical protein